jgi:hypothetical protein
VIGAGAASELTIDLTAARSIESGAVPRARFEVQSAITRFL